METTGAAEIAEAAETSETLADEQKDAALRRMPHVGEDNLPENTESAGEDGEEEDKTTQSADEATEQTEAKIDTADGSADQVQQAQAEAEQAAAQAEAEQAAAAAKAEAERIEREQTALFLKDLAKAGVKLANARSSKEITVINVYAGKDGEPDLEPLEDWLTDDKKAMDVTDGDILINVIAASAKQDLKMDGFLARNREDTSEDKDIVAAGKLVVVFGAMDGTSFTEYEGKLVLTEDAQGTYIAPKAQVELKKTLTGALYADTVVAENETVIEKAVYGQQEAEPETEEAPVIESNLPVQTEQTETPQTERVRLRGTLRVTSPAKASAAEESKDEETQPSETTSQTLLGANNSADDTKASETPASETTTSNTTAAETTPSDASDAETPSSDTKASETEVKKQESLTLEVTAADDEKKLVSAKFGLFYKDSAGKESALQVKDGSTEKAAEVTTDEKTGKAVFTIDPDSCEAIGALKNGETMELTLRALTAPEGYYTKEKEQTITVTRENAAESESSSDQASTESADAENGGDQNSQENSQEAGESSQEKEKEDSQSADQKDTADTDESSGLVSWQPQTATFTFEPVATSVQVTLAPVEEGKTDVILQGATFTVYYLENNQRKPLTDQSGTTLQVKANQDKAYPMTLSADVYPAIAAMTNGSALTLEIVENTFPLGYTYVSTNTQSLVLTKDTDGCILADSEEVLFPHRKASKISLIIRTRTQNSTDEDENLSGASYVIGARSDTQETVLIKDSQGKNLTLKSADLAAAGYKITLDDSQNPILRALTQAEGSNTVIVTVSEVTIPSGYNAVQTDAGLLDREIVITREADNSLSVAVRKTVTKDDGTTQTVDEEASDGVPVLTYLHKKVNSKLAKYKIRVNKRLYYNNVEIYASQRQNYYVALFSDAAKTRRVSNVKRLTMKTGKLASTTVTFTVYERGDYYISETDAFGKPIGLETDKTKAVEGFYADYVSTDHIRIGIKTKSGTVFPSSSSAYTIRNHYFEMPEGYSYTASFRITKNVLDYEGNALGVKETFKVNVYDVTDQNNRKLLTKEPVSINMNGNSSATVNKSMVLSSNTKSIQIEEVVPDAYSATYSSQTIVLQKAGTRPEITITNKRKSADNPVEDESGSAGAGDAKLTLVKQVMYGKKNVRINATYYIGIFSDPDLAPEHLVKNRAIKFTNASKVTTKPLTIHLDKTPNGSITLYFAETDSKGVPVKSGKAFGYNITQSAEKVTFDKDNLEAEVTFTNSMLSGGSAERRYLDPSSGTAPDSTAMAEYQAAKSEASSGQNTATGDDTPVTQMVVTLSASFLVIVGVVIWFIFHRQFRRR
ncbi:MAG: hypothetical protein IJI24_02640 [Lachnospiraceae bacterium]|nr:hypothetical protein [Lachnospiraceae bacterium]